MRASIVTASALLAASCAAQYLNQTDPFNLVVISSNDTINGSALGACHEGAAIEGFCLGGASSFKLNYTDTQIVDPTIGTLGYLTWLLQGSGFNLTSPMSLSYSTSSNVAIPLLQPTESGTQVSIANGTLYIPGYIDDTVVPPVYNATVYDRWYICETNAGYAYTTLAWTLGDTIPQNPTCQKVSVVQVFVDEE